MTECIAHLQKALHGVRLAAVHAREEVKQVAHAANVVACQSLHVLNTQPWQSAPALQNVSI